MHSQDFYNYLEMFGMENVACRYLFLPLVYLYGWHVCRIARCPGAMLEAFTSQRLHHRAQVQRVTAGDIWVAEEGGQG